MEKTYVVQTSQKVVERCILMTTDPGDLVLLDAKPPRVLVRSVFRAVFNFWSSESG
jgi:hypothetical protein